LDGESNTNQEANRTEAGVVSGTEAEANTLDAPADENQTPKA
jgi:hypothetical protein